MDSSLNDQEHKKRNSSTNKINSKRRRKNANPSRYVDPTSFNASWSTNSTKGKSAIYCKNLACLARLSREDLFCKRCSCCICYKYDDNKNLSRWLTCNSYPPFAGESCGLSCHLNCAFKNEKSGLKEDKPSNGVDGCFYCVSCGKTNSLLECWKDQLMIAKETRKVDELCCHLVLAQKLLKGTKKYMKLSEIVVKAVKSLETELCGPLTDLPSAMRRGIVNKLSFAPKVKNYCSSALKSLKDSSLDDLLMPSKMQGSTKIIFKDVRATTLTLILGSKKSTPSENIIHHNIWHRKVSEKDYPKDLTSTLVSPNTRFRVSGLIPATEYCFKVVSYSGSKSSVDETKVSTKTPKEEEKEASFVNCLSARDEEKQLVVKEVVPKNTVKGENSAASCGFELEDCVKIIRQLEVSGYVEKNFREKFLTWYSLRATTQEINVVKTFIDTFKDDSIALAEQLIDTFFECISRKRSAISSGDGGGNRGAYAKFCKKPRH